MKLDDGKLILTEAELVEVKRANVMASPSIAGIYLRSFIKIKNLVEDLEKQPDVSFYTECIQAYRKKNYEIIQFAKLITQRQVKTDWRVQLDQEKAKHLKIQSVDSNQQLRSLESYKNTKNTSFS